MSSRASVALERVAEARDADEAVWCAVSGSGGRVMVVLAVAG